MSTLPLITFPILIRQEDMALWTELYARYHASGAPALQAALAVDRSDHISPKTDAATPNRSLYSTVTEECTCGKCFDTLVRHDRLPWTRTPERSLRHCQAPLYTPCLPVQNKLPTRGYIYKPLPNLKELEIEKRLAVVSTKLEVQKAEIEAVTVAEQTRQEKQDIKQARADTVKEKREELTQLRSEIRKTELSERKAKKAHEAVKVSLLQTTNRLADIADDRRKALKGRNVLDQELHVQEPHLKNLAASLKAEIVKRERDLESIKTTWRDQKEGANSLIDQINNLIEEEKSTNWTKVWKA